MSYRIFRASLLCAAACWWGVACHWVWSDPEPDDDDDTPSLEDYDTLTEEEYSVACGDKFCVQSQECDPGKDCVVEEDDCDAPLDVSSCEFNGYAAQACVESEWSCVDGQVQQAEVCNSVYTCDGKDSGPFGDQAI